MSIKDSFYEVLEKKYGIPREEVFKYEIEKDKVQVHLKDGKIVKIENPSTIRIAKLSQLDLEESHREDMIKQLYGIEVVFSGLKIPYQRFRERYKNVELERLRSELIEAENKYLLSHQDKETYKEFVKLLIHRRLIERGRGVPIHLLQELDNMSLLELLDRLTRVS